MDLIKGFSKLNKDQKIDVLINKQFLNGASSKELLSSFWHKNEKEQEVFDQFSENTISNYYFPYGVVPNFLLNKRILTVPMVIEESSVVAACSKAAKFWASRGGFNTKVISTVKVGQVHFEYEGSKEELEGRFLAHKNQILESTNPLTENMRKRGGGLLDIELVDKTNILPNFFQLHGSFETCDAMGANFINSVLEHMAKELEDRIGTQTIMSILSNYTPDCRVYAEVRAKISEMEQKELGVCGKEFCEKFIKAVKISQADVYRAVTHNKGIFNGIDAVVLATGNDFRAVEACAHAHAARDGQYRGLSEAKIEGDEFVFSLELPISLGTVGGLTGLHPLAKASLDILNRPSASELMEVAVSIGLAQNFAAIRSLVTTGIQKGHMKMHLLNILNHLEASEQERENAKKYFLNKTVSFPSVREFLSLQRAYQ